jgi:hypothetical protein
MDRHVALFGTLSWFRVNQSSLFLLNAAVLNGEAINTNLIVFSLTWSGLKPTIYGTQGCIILEIPWLPSQVDWCTCYRDVSGMTLRFVSWTGFGNNNFKKGAINGTGVANLSSLTLSLSWSTFACFLLF